MLGRQIKLEETKSSLTGDDNSLRNRQIVLRKKILSRSVNCKHFLLVRFSLSKAVFMVKNAIVILTPMFYVLPCRPYKFFGRKVRRTQL